MSLNSEIEACKAHFLKREREILDNCTKLLSEAREEQVEYAGKLAALNKLFDHMEYDWRYRHLTIREDDLNLLGFKVINGVVDLS
jgi:hypothetical protein